MRSKSTARPPAYSPASCAPICQKPPSTMNQALKTVIPVKKQAKEQVSRSIALKIDKVKARAQLALCEAKKQKAKARLFRALIDADDGARLEYSFVTGKLSVSAATIRALEQSG